MIHSQKIGKQKETYAGFAPIIKISTKTITTMKKSFMFMTFTLRSGNSDFVLHQGR